MSVSRYSVCAQGGVCAHSPIVGMSTVMPMVWCVGWCEHTYTHVHMAVFLWVRCPRGDGVCMQPKGARVVTLAGGHLRKWVLEKRVWCQGIWNDRSSFAPLGRPFLESLVLFCSFSTFTSRRKSSSLLGTLCSSLGSIPWCWVLLQEGFVVMAAPGQWM